MRCLGCGRAGTPPTGTEYSQAGALEGASARDLLARIHVTLKRLGCVGGHHGEESLIKGSSTSICINFSIASRVFVGIAYES